VLLGPWLLHVWSATGDPFYPQSARFFHSPFAGDGWNLDRWSLRNWREAPEWRVDRLIVNLH
jgi:hypothetical protein